MAFSVQKTASMYQILCKLSKAFILLILISCGSNEERLPYYNESSFTPIFINSDKEVNEKITHMIKPFNFTNQHGKTVSDATLDNKVYIANFIFTTCGSICPAITSNLKKLEKDFGNHPDFAILSFTVTPWKDSVPTLKKYAKDYDIQINNWHFLTGDKSEIYDLARNSYFAEMNIGLKKGPNDFLHTEHIILIDQNKRIRGIYNGTLPLEINQLSSDLKTLLKMK